MERRSLTPSATEGNRPAAAELPGWISDSRRVRDCDWRLQDVLACVDHGILLTDCEGRHLFANGAACGFFGLIRDAADSGLRFPEGLAWATELGRSCGVDQLPTFQVLKLLVPQVGVVLSCATADGVLRWFRIGARPLVSGGSGEPLGVVTTFTDITDLVLRQEQLEKIANCDPLTKLPNRRLLFDRLTHALAAASRSSQMLAVCCIDLDGFKEVNDTYGHEQGDLLLVDVARRIKDCLRAGDTVSRVGGDEFVLLLPNLNNVQECEQVLDRILSSLCSPHAREDDVPSGISASIGVAFHPNDAADADALLRFADSAMYTAKREGKNRYCLYDAQLEHEADRQRRLLEEVAAGIDAGQFVLWYLPAVDLASGKVLGVEALVRWRHPSRGLLAPADFLPQIYKSNLIVRLGDWVVQEALAQWERWRSEGLDLPVSINVALRQLLHGSFVATLKAALERHPEMPPGRLQLELAESASADYLAEICEVMESCRRIGVRFAIDDFGTGFSSLNYFRHLPADTLKIDRSFIDAMHENDDDFLLVRGIIAVADAFGRTVVAEGVSNAEQGARLLSMGCRVVQGYGLARPMPPRELSAWCGKFRLDPCWRVTGRVRPGHAEADARFPRVRERRAGCAEAERSPG
ncbi:MAG TPA: EAL domain-containing protein [Rhodocyclaceae bacterium]